MEKKMLSFIADLKRKISDLSKDDKEKQEEKEADNHSNAKDEEKETVKGDTTETKVDLEASESEVIEKPDLEQEGKQEENVQEIESKPKDLEEITEERIEEIVEEEVEQKLETQEEEKIEEPETESIEEPEQDQISEQLPEKIVETINEKQEEIVEETVEEKLEEKLEETAKTVEEIEKNIESTETQVKKIEEEKEQEELEMGKCCSCEKSYDTLEPEAEDGETTGQDKNDSESFEQEKTILFENVVESDMVKSCCIVSFPSGKIRATYPEDFIPRHEGVQYVIEGFQNKPENLIKHGVSLGCNLPDITPGRYDEGEGLYSIDDVSQIGCAIVKTKQCLLFVVFEGQLAPACRLASETGNLMRERGL